MASQAKARTGYWKFPIVGKVPYLRVIFKKSRRLKMEEVKKQGYDTYLRGAGAYSRSDWFEDPVFSSLLDYQKPLLANVILHELSTRPSSSRDTSRTTRALRRSSAIRRA